MTVTLDFKPSRHTDAYRFTTTDRDALEVLALKRQIAAALMLVLLMHHDP